MQTLILTSFLGQPAQLEDQDNPDWVPNQNMGYVSINTKDQDAVRRHSRITKRSKRVKLVISLLQFNNEIV